MTHDWQVITTLLAAAGTVLGVPLTAILFYLKVIRDDQRHFQTGFLRRISKIEAECDRIELALEKVERRYTPRDEWLRETLLARNQLGRLTEILARVQAEMESSRALATQFVRATHAIIQLTERLGRRLSESASNSLDGEVSAGRA